MPRKRPTIKDVAQRAGVSFKTVSRVINGQRGVSEEVQRRVRQAILELGYVVNYSARSLALGGGSVTGVVIPRLTDLRSMDMIFHVGEVAERRGLGLLIFNRPASEYELGFTQFIGHGLVSSLLVMGPRSLSAYLPFIRALGTPTVVVESVFESEEEPPIPCIVSDNYGGAKSGVQYLCSLGHRRIAYIAGGDSYQNQQRFRGYRDALMEAGLEIDDNLIYPGRWTWQSGHDAVLALLEKPHPPTAIFAANDAMALGAMCALRERGLRIPRNMSIIGFDDIPAAATSQPPLTTIRQPTVEMVELAFDLLQRAREGKEVKPQTHVLPTELIIRESCAPPLA